MILQDLNRVSDPINSEQLSSMVSSALGKYVWIEVTPEEAIAIGDISEADRTAIQNVINSYSYIEPSPVNHTHPIADVTNLQAKLDEKADTIHNHDAAYATVSHNHDGSYAPTNHNHDALYAPTVHTHNYAPLAHSHTSYAVLANGATAMGFGTNTTVKVTPTANATYTTTVPTAGTTVQLIILTSGATSRTITFGTGFKAVGTLATGTVSARVFVINWISDGTNLYEAGRTAAMVA